MTKVISKDELKGKIHNITLIDVRDSYAYNYGHIQGAEDIPLEKLENEFKQRYSPEEKNIVIYGEDEQMGAEALSKLANMGYNNIELYKDGFQEWRHSHLPIKRGDLGQARRENREY